MPEYNYFPILKSTDAELRGFDELATRVKDRVLPTFELTRSRRSSTNPQGDVWRRVESVHECVGSRPFILDLTTELSLQNPEIDEMLNDASHGFRKWVSFVKRVSDEGLSVIPVVHYNADEVNEVKRQVRALSELSATLAFRVSAGDDVAGYIESIEDSIELDDLILILDAGFHDSRSEANLSDRFPAVLDSLRDKSSKAVVCACSSFPSSVSNFGDRTGNFPISEVAITEGLRSRYPEIFHGDYGSVHPVRYEGRWGGWVPRIDFPAENRFFYYRYRRDDGGYEAAARSVRRDAHYSRISDFDVWGDLEISDAAAGDPNGRSPSHWIAVRINLFLTRQYLRLKAPQYRRMSL